MNVWGGVEVGLGAINGADFRAMCVVLKTQMRADEYGVYLYDTLV